MRFVIAAGLAAALAAQAADPGTPTKLASAPGWPEEIGELDPLVSREILALLERATGSEATYGRGLIQLEPVPGYAPALARADLVAVATARGEPDWQSRARYALARLDELSGDVERAGDAYVRVLVDHPGSPAAARAGVGRARLLLREGRCGEASRSLQESIEGGAPPASHAGPLRELAVRCLLGPTAGGSGPERTATPLRTVDGWFPTPAGAVLIAVNRDDRVSVLGPGGQPEMIWDLPDLQAVTLDPAGRFFAAAGEFIHRLAPDGRILRGAALGAYAPVSALAADGTGGLWVADRRGERIGRIAPGAASPEPFWEDVEVRLSGLVWDGQRLVGLDEKNKRLLTLAPDGTVGLISLAHLVRPVAVAADPAGGLAVLDTRLGHVQLLWPTGASRGTVDYTQHKIEKPVALGLGFDGVLHLFDSAAGEWVRFP